MGRELTAATTAVLALVIALSWIGQAEAESSARAVIGAKPCPGEATYAWMGSSRAKTVTVPSLTEPYGTTSYPGTILKPTDTIAYPGPRPVVVLQHGNNGDQCRLWWVAQDLAGHGYVTLTWTVPSASTQQNFIRSVDATRSALAFARGAGNPYLPVTDSSRMAILGASLGAITTSYVQGDGDPSVRAAIGFDNLVPSVPAGSGEDGEEGLCSGSEGILDVVPKVPALGFDADGTCENPDGPVAESKRGAFRLWRDAGIPHVELVMDNYGHTDFMANGSESQRLEISHYVRAWLDLWLGGDATGEDRMLAETVNGRPTSTLLDPDLKSAAFLPPRVDTPDLIAWFDRDVVSPQTKRRTGPDRRVERTQLHKRGLTFRFGSTEPGGSFECRLDRRVWKRCRSPERLRKAALGRHNFRVRAIDAAGNVDPEPSRWRFRVVR